MLCDYCYLDGGGYAGLLARCYLRRREMLMPDEAPLVRQWILLRTLCARHHGATVKEMAQDMAVSEKTIRRDLETFQRAGFPLLGTCKSRGGIRANGSRQSPTVL